MACTPYILLESVFGVCRMFVHVTDSLTSASTDHLHCDHLRRAICNAQVTALASGEHTVIFQSAAGAVTAYATCKFTVADSNLGDTADCGFVRVDPELKQHFVTSGGKSWYGVGMNLGWVSGATSVKVSWSLGRRVTWRDLWEFPARSTSISVSAKTLRLLGVMGTWTPLGQFVLC
jgi:hypothetical protein